MNKLFYIFIPVVICSVIWCSTFSKVMLSDITTTSNTQQVTSRPTLIIDPGHGGFDGGASTSDGYAEKHINLNISMYLRELLLLSGYEVIITRTTDESLEDEGLSTIREKKRSDIYNRMKIMNDTPDALFISIHQNHFSQEKYNGLQVFYSANFSETSQALAESIQETAIELLQPNNTRLVKECGTSVYLLYNAVKPAVLVECGFLSNHEESSKLKTDEYQRKIAFCLFIGIQNFLLKGR